MADFIFWVIWILIVVSAGLVAFGKNLIHSVFALMGTFLGVAGIYIFLNADFLAVTQIVVYVGGILVLLVFGIMLTNQISTAKISQSSVQRGLGLLVVLALLAILLTALLSHDWVGTTQPLAFEETARGIGRLLFTDYLILFEIASVLLLGALIGAATLARKEL
ncbi:MAG: NADH-quinone oxidoreductase subunit J [Candidatus Marinimicrobia bacterium]|nr:NADH-quinone oxidoreductase subunit J [Candidatus Neomarinimicrobiota bacterium]MCF7850451.1 NADH-quinone oxidoreductase subunit J [Candidatus Neomarinimicrobiota bacterium]MCF7904971.1 NADH-quinone oxidoreductase subunit J [Candidatus Neomarinimicrobiota bacterium]